MIQTILVTTLLAVWQNPTPVYVGPGDQTIDMVISDGAGGAAVLWHDVLTGWEFMNVIDSAGNLKWGKQSVAVLVMGDTTTQNPDMFLDSLGNYWIALEAQWNSPSQGWDICIQKISPQGQRLFGDKGINVCNGDWGKLRPRLCQSGGGVIVTWLDYRAKSLMSLIFAQRYGNDGSSQWATNGISVCDSTSRKEQRFADPVPDGNNGALVVLEKWFRDTSDNFIFAQRLDSLGNRLFEDTCRFIHRGTFDPLAIGPLAKNAMSDGECGAIFFYVNGGYFNGQRIDTMGGVLWGTDGVIVGKDDYQHFADFSPLSNNGIFVVRGESNVQIHQAVYAHRVTLDGEIPWGDTGKVVWWVEGLDPLGFVGDIATSASDEGIIIWKDVADHNGSYKLRGIMAQKMDTLGNTLWLQEVVITGPEGSNPKTITTQDKGAIVTWQTGDIYAARIDSLGNISGVEEEPLPRTEPLLQVWEPYPNPAVVQAIIRFALREPASINVSIFDASGRKVTQLAQGAFSAGEHLMHWECTSQGSRVSSGVYFIKVSTAKASQTTKLIIIK